MQNPSQFLIIFPFPSILSHLSCRHLLWQQFFQWFTFVILNCSYSFMLVCGALCWRKAAVSLIRDWGQGPEITLQPATFSGVWSSITSAGCSDSTHLEYGPWVRWWGRIQARVPLCLGHTAALQHLPDVSSVQLDLCLFFLVKFMSLCFRVEGLNYKMFPSHVFVSTHPWLLPYPNVSWSIDSARVFFVWGGMEHKCLGPHWPYIPKSCACCNSASCHFTQCPPSFLPHQCFLQYMLCGSFRCTVGHGPGSCLRWPLMSNGKVFS